MAIAYCFDTDVLSTIIKRNPPMALVRRFALVHPSQQFTTSITLGEMLFGAAKKGDPRLTLRVRKIIREASVVLPFDEPAAEVYGPLRSELETAGRPLAEPDLRIASIALAHDLILVTGNVKHFERIPNLSIENWIQALDSEME
jgi:tRNA(fMet)-specific endonuclease VapC